MTVVDAILEIISVEDIMDFVLNNIDTNNKVPHIEDNDAMDAFWEKVEDDLFITTYGFHNAFPREYSGRNICIMMNYLKEHDVSIDAFYSFNVDTIVNTVVQYLIRDTSGLKIEVESLLRTYLGEL